MACELGVNEYFLSLPHVHVGSLPYTIFVKDLGVRPILYLYTELTTVPQSLWGC